MPGVKPKEKVSRVWSRDLAYAVGLLATDGNLSPDDRHINFTSKDIDQVKAFKKCLGIKNKIGKKGRSGNSEKKYFVIQFGDIAFYNWLLKLGLTPNKSRTIGKLNIPDQYFFDFLRGHFDGDGCISAYWDKRWHSSFMFYLRFCSASRKHLEWLDKTVYRLCGAKGRVKGNEREYELAFAKKASQILFPKMYHSRNVPALKRKLTKIKKVIEVNNRHDQSPGGEIGTRNSLRGCR